ncbi:MAG: NUDIX domain-containing protein [Tenericutes bacterium]|nr:NUDIX domain-containing protein [Mycoplasmatota bacterium]
MKEEVKFKTEEYNYYNRAVGIIKKDDMYLILNVDNSPYYHIPGGHIEIGEDSLSAVTREIKEELGFTVKEAKLFCIQENFYEKKGIIQHGVEYYYLIETVENLDTTDLKIEENDRGTIKQLFIKWVTAKELENIDLRPFTVKNLLINNRVDTLTHIIQRD